MKQNKRIQLSRQMECSPFRSLKSAVQSGEGSCHPVKGNRRPPSLFPVFSWLYSQLDILESLRKQEPHKGGGYVI
ncbi:hypothetical protein LEMLEM_LOCUS15855 [Lemmus lemmus]